MRVSQHIKFSILLLLIICFPIFSSFAKDNLINDLSENYPLYKRQLAKDRLIEMGVNSIPFLIQGLKSPDESVRIECIKLLGEIKVKEAIPKLIEHLRNASDTRSIVVTTYALGQMQDNRVTPEFITMAASSDPIQKRAAIIALGISGDTTAITLLEEILYDHDEIIRVFAAGSLGLLGSDKGLEIALKATESTDFSTRFHAIQALGIIGNKDALAKLNGMLKNKPEKVEKDTIEMSIFQINLKSQKESEKVDLLKNKLLNTTKKNVLNRWCFSELLRIGGSNVNAALDEIIKISIREDIRNEAIRTKNIQKITDNLEGGTSNGK